MQTKGHLVLVAIDGNKETYRVIGDYITVTWTSIYRSHRGTKGNWRAMWPRPAVQRDADCKDCKWLNAERRRITKESAVVSSARSRATICNELLLVIPEDLIPAIDFHLGAACWLKGYYQAPTLVTDICAPEYIDEHCAMLKISDMRKYPNIFSSAAGVPKMYSGIRIANEDYIMGYCDDEGFANIVPGQRIFLVSPGNWLKRIFLSSTLFHVLQQKQMTLGE